MLLLTTFTKKTHNPPLPTPIVCRGQRLRRGVRLQVHRDVGVPPPQRAGPVRGHRPADTPEERQQGGERAAHGQLQAQGEHRQEGQAVPGSHGGTQEQEDGLQAEVQVLPRPHGSLRTGRHRRTLSAFTILFVSLASEDQTLCVCFNTNPKGLIEL